MKVTLDLTRLREEGRLSAEECEKLLRLGQRETGSLGINILAGFGVVAVALGIGALIPSPVVALGIGAVIFLAGIGLSVARLEAWWLLAQIWLVTGALIFCGSLLVLGEGNLQSLILVTLALAGAAIVARSSLLIVAAVLALGACLGARTGYRHAMYMLAIYQPLITVILFSALAYGAYRLSKFLNADYERLAINAARAAVFMVNFGFWIGSLWGDDLTFLGPQHGRLPSWPFTIGWALALVAVGVWGVRVNRRWVVNIAAVFGVIHFYTQWFEILGLQPLAILIGGLLVLAIAFALWRFNRRTAVPAAPLAA